MLNIRIRNRIGSSWNTAYFITQWRQMTRNNTGQASRSHGIWQGGKLYLEDKEILGGNKLQEQRDTTTTPHPTPGMATKEVKRWSSRGADNPLKARPLVSSTSRSTLSKTSAAPDMCATRAHAAQRASSWQSGNSRRSSLRENVTHRWLWSHLR